MVCGLVINRSYFNIVGTTDHIRTQSEAGLGDLDTVTVRTACIIVKSPDILSLDYKRISLTVALNCCRTFV